MENKNPSETFLELPNALVQPRADFPSEEAMKTYYLQLADIMNIRFIGEFSEDITIKCLHRKLRQLRNVMRFVGTHEWGKGIAEIQKACGTYMMQSDIPHKTLLQANEEIALHLQFVIQLASYTGFVKQLEGILCYHLENVNYLLSKENEEKEI